MQNRKTEKRKIPWKSRVSQISARVSVVGPHSEFQDSQLHFKIQIIGPQEQ